MMEIFIKEVKSMLGKLLFYSVSLVAAWAGLVLTFQGWVMPGVLITGFGLVVFNVVCSAGRIE